MLHMLLTTIDTSAQGPGLLYCDTHYRYRRTVGVDFYKAHLALPGETLVSVQMWDVGSGVSSLQMAANYLHGCDAVLMVYDISRAQVIENVCCGVQQHTVYWAELLCLFACLPELETVVATSQALHATTDASTRMYADVGPGARMAGRPDAAVQQHPTTVPGPCW